MYENAGIQYYCDCPLVKESAPQKPSQPGVNRQMLFEIEEDHGSRISGYIVPDSFTQPTRIRFVDGETCLLEFEANSTRPALVSAGRHGTGQCGFTITDKEIPGLADIRGLEIQEAETRFTVFRRYRPEAHISMRLLRLETCHVPTGGLDRQLAPHFQIAHTMLDRHGRETVTQAFMVKSCESHYVSARFPYREFEFSIDDTFKRFCVLRDPYVELAHTIFALTTDNAAGSVFGLREQLSLEDCMTYFSDVDLGSESSLRSALATMPGNVEGELSNQLTRLLAARTADESSRSTHLAAALETLSLFDIVGLHEQPETYFEPLQELTARGITAEVDTPPEEVHQLAGILRKLPVAQGLLDMDLEVYETVRDALAQQS